MKAFWRETWIVFSRAMRLSLRNPIWVVLGLVQPVLYLALFGPLLEKVVQATPGLPPGDAWQIFVPGLMVQLGLFGTAFVGFGLIAEYRAGVIERMRVTPAHRLALLLGRVARDVVVILVQGTALTLAAIPFGLRAPLGGVVAALVMVGLLGAALSSLSYTAALITKSEDALAPLLNGVAVPLLLLSGILLPMTLAPRWLRVLSDANPFKHAVDAVRALFRGETGGSAIGWGVLSVVALVAVSLWLGARTFKAEAG